MDLIDNPDYHVYKNKDGRTRIYDKKTHKVTSYPRFLMSNYLGRTLRPDEQIHHVDGDFTNNSIDNLLVLPEDIHHYIHRKDTVKYRDKIAVCYYCGKRFLWKAHSQQLHNMNVKRNKIATGPFCSKRCVGLYGTDEKRRRKATTECE